MFLQRLGLTGIVSVALYSSMKESETKEIWYNLQNPKGEISQNIYCRGCKIPQHAYLHEMMQLKFRNFCIQRTLRKIKELNTLILKKALGEHPLIW